MYEKFVNYNDIFFEIADEFGGKGRNDQLKYVKRNNTKGSFPVGAYFGCINWGEESSGPYSDLSIVVVPSNESNPEDDRWMVALVIGSLGFKNDYDIVTLPGTRRRFARCLQGKSNLGTSFIKNDFLDIESQDGFKSYCEANEIPETLGNSVKNYGKVILSATIIKPNDEEQYKAAIRLYLGLYATIRNWPSNKTQRDEIHNAISVEVRVPDEENDIKELLGQRKYVVLQGAPGTGKTRMAKRITAGCSNVFFTQFHAETSYSDFVYGILPDTENDMLRYKGNEGVFIKAIKAAINKKDEIVYLIIDEINRANLSNVLGPAFYLFEPTMSDSGIKIEVCPNSYLGKMPDNLYVIATMNTADRSLAVVDFALRRRFAWYTMIPHAIKVEPGYVFCAKEFNAIKDIFEEYATDEELNLQPGQSYFVVSDRKAKNEIELRLKYEIMPLIKEYLANGMLSRSKDDFVNYFRNRIREEMYR